MRLKEFSGVGTLLQGDPELDITGLSYDSRRVAPGNLFVAIRGLKDDGHRYLNDACARGAVCVVTEPGTAAPPGVAHLRVASSRAALAEIAVRFWGDPSRHLRMIGVTGTNGKTTTTFLVRAILQAAGRPTGLIGTVHNYAGGIPLPVTHTTPESADVQALLARMLSLGDGACVMEVSSHALVLDRVAGVEYDAAVFTNLTQDHLDFHGSMEAYFAAKARLFEGLGRGAAKSGPKWAIVNADDPAGPELLRRCSAQAFTYGVQGPADVMAKDIKLAPTSLRYRLVAPQGEVDLRLPLSARFNVYNSLAAAALGLAEGIDLAAVAAGLSTCRGAGGRFEAVDEGQEFGAFVDYAHTPDGLRSVLRTARDLTRGRVIVVFGCGGDRDRGKRPQMGRIAGELADFSVVTSDNPRSEDPLAIIAEIEAGLRPLAPGRYALEADRTTAIGLAVAMAQPGDAVVVAGKGHETYQIFKDRTVAFSDREALRKAIAARQQPAP